MEEQLIQLIDEYNFVDFKKLFKNFKEVFKNGTKTKGILIRIYCFVMQIYIKYTEESGYDIDIEDDYWELIYEADRNWEDLPLHLDEINVLIEYLIDNGANINYRDSFGDTILHYAVQFGTLQHVQTLVEKGADFNIKNGENKSPFDLVIYGNRAYIIKYFTQKAIKVNNLTKNNFDYLKRLIYWVNYKWDNENTIHVKHETANILVRKGFNASNFPMDTKIRKQYELYKKERETAKQVVNIISQKNKISLENENYIVNYLGVETIYDVNFKFLRDGENNNNFNADLEIKKLYNLK